MNYDEATNSRRLDDSVGDKVNWLALAAVALLFVLQNERFHDWVRRKRYDWRHKR